MIYFNDGTTMDIEAYGEYGEDIDAGSFGDYCFAMNWHSRGEFTKIKNENCTV